MIVSLLPDRTSSGSCPHPPLSILDRGDRHLVAYRTGIVNCLNIIEDMLVHLIQLYEEMKNEPGHYHWNNELVLSKPFRPRSFFLPTLQPKRLRTIRHSA